MNTEQIADTAEIGQSALTDGLYAEIYYCKHCGSARMYQVFKLLCCMNCCNAYSVDDHCV